MSEAQFTDEDVNQPTQEPLDLLERLKSQIGNVPPRFWATCHFCDLQALEPLVRSAELTASQTYSMVPSGTQPYIPISLWGAPTPQPDPIQVSSEIEDDTPRQRQKTSTRYKSAHHRARE